MKRKSKFVDEETLVVSKVSFIKERTLKVDKDFYHFTLTNSYKKNKIILLKTKLRIKRVSWCVSFLL